MFQVEEEPDFGDEEEPADDDEGEVKADDTDEQKSEDTDEKVRQQPCGSAWRVVEYHASILFHTISHS